MFEPQSSSDWNSHNAVTAKHTFTKPGVYTVSLSVTNGAGSTTVTKKNYITVLAKPSKPTADFYADTTYGYAPLSVHFYSYGVTGNPTDYFWVFEPQTRPNWNSHHAVNAVHTFSRPGWYTVSLVVSNKYGSTTTTKTRYIYVGY